MLRLSASRPALVPLLLAACAALPAVDEPPTSSTDYRLGFELIPSYDIEEVSTVGGVTTTYDWVGDDDGQAWQGTFEWVRQWHRADRGGPELGLQVALGAQRVEPTAFTVAGIGYDNTQDIDLTWRQLGVGVLAGWQSLPPVIEELTLGYEVAVFARASALFGSLKGQGLSDDALGFGWDAGLRLAALVAERNWMAGLTVSYTVGSAELDLAPASGTSTTLHLTRQGLGYGALAVYRF